MPTLTPTAHIWLDDRQRAWIDDTNVKVIEVALDHVAYGWNAETIFENFPDFTMAQIHAALGYYYDHKEEYDRLIAESHERAEALHRETLNSPIRQRLRALGKL